MQRLDSPHNLPHALFLVGFYSHHPSFPLSHKKKPRKKAEHKPLTKQGGFLVYSDIYIFLSWGYIFPMLFLLPLSSAKTPHAVPWKNNHYLSALCFHSDLSNSTPGQASNTPRMATGAPHALRCRWDGGFALNEDGKVTSREAKGEQDMRRGKEEGRGQKKRDVVV